MKNDRNIGTAVHQLAPVTPTDFCLYRKKARGSLVVSASSVNATSERKMTDISYSNHDTFCFVIGITVRKRKNLILTLWNYIMKFAAITEYLLLYKTSREGISH